MNNDVLRALAPTGVLRAGINLSNFLLVNGTAPNGDPTGVSPSMARAVADRLGVDLEIVTFDSPGQLADAANDDIWDIGNIGAESKRAEHIAFSAAYCEIECTYVVPAKSAITTMADIDKPGVRIATKSRAAYTLFLEENLEHASLVQTATIDDSFDAFVNSGLEALAGLKPRLLDDVKRLDGARILEGSFRVVQQAIGTPSNRGTAGAVFLAGFVEEAKASGLVASLIKSHQVVGLSVAPPA